MSLLHTQILSIDHYAKADFGKSYHLECPHMREKPGFKFTNLFHPLLKNPVKNDVDCHQGHHGIVISGLILEGRQSF